MSAWTVDLDLRDERVDYLGHITAAAHLAIFEEARARWLMAIMDDDQPSFVLAHQELDYRRELLLSARPITVSVAPVSLGATSLTIVEEIRSATGVHTESRAVLVRWDRAGRRPMAFPSVERERIERRMSRH